MTLCKCGCGQPAPIAPKTESLRGYVKGEARDYVCGHNARRTPESYRVEDRGHATPCWVWQRTINQGGYGMVTDNGRTRTAHRAYYERHKGAVPVGYEIDHLCRVKTCVNPAHLEAVTPKENVRRHHWRDLDGGTNLRRRRVALNYSQAELAALLGVAQTTISKWERRARPTPVWVEPTIARLDPVGEAA